MGRSAGLVCLLGLVSGAGITVTSSSLLRCRYPVMPWADHARPPLATVGTFSRLHCGIRCSRRPDCAAVAFDAATSQCQLLGCPAGWSAFCGNCYKLSVSPQLQDLAASCAALPEDAAPASILSAEENEFIRSLVSASGSLAGHIGLWHEPSYGDKVNIKFVYICDQIGGCKYV